MDAHEAVILYKTDGQIVAWNKGAETIYGWNHQEAVKMNLNRVVLLKNKYFKINRLRAMKYRKLLRAHFFIDYHKNKRSIKI